MWFDNALLFLRDYCNRDETKWKTVNCYRKDEKQDVEVYIYGK